MVNWGSEYTNSEPRTKMKIAINFGVANWFWQRWNCIKLKVWRQLRIQFKSIGRIETQLKFVTMYRSDLMKRRWMAHRLSPCTFVLLILADRVGNFKRMNVELQTSKMSEVGSKWKVCTVHPFYQFQVVLGNDNIRIAPTWPRKWATQPTLTVQLSCKNRFGFRMFTHKGSLMGSYQRVYNTSLNTKRSEMDSRPPKTLEKTYKYPFQDQEKGRKNVKRGKRKKILTRKLSVKVWEANTKFSQVS